MAVHCSRRTARPRPVSPCWPREARAGRRVTASHHWPGGSGDARQASARRARRAPARQGSAFADAPGAARPSVTPAEAAARVVIVSPFFAP
jgi:hypothetical protein